MSNYSLLKNVLSDAKDLAFEIMLQTIFSFSGLISKKYSAQTSSIISFAMYFFEFFLISVVQNFLFIKITSFSSELNGVLDDVI